MKTDTHMRNQSPLEKRVMHRIYAIWLFRRVRSSQSIRLAVFIALMFAGSFYVSYADVARNVHHIQWWHFASLETYVTVALSNTEFAVKALTAAAALLALALLVDMSRFVGRFMQRIAFSRSVR